MNGKKVGVLFPGIGYTNERPLMYYSRKLLLECGYDVIEVNYTGFEKKVKGNQKKMREAFEHGKAEAEKILSDYDWGLYEDIVFVGKSIGTAIAADYAIEKELNVREIYLTPLAMTLMKGMPKGMAFTGTADPWVDTETLPTAFKETDIPVQIYKGANHSLETEDTVENTKILTDVMENMKKYL